MKYRTELNESFGNMEVQVVVTFLRKKEVQTVAGFLEISGCEEDFRRSLEHVCEMCEMMEKCEVSDLSSAR